MEDTRIVLLSIREHMEAALDTAGWTDPDKWVIVGHVEPETRPPVVAVTIANDLKVGFEVGSVAHRGNYFVEIHIYAVDAMQLIDLKDAVQNNLRPMRIINFNTAMPGDGGYDADAQTIAWAHIRDVIKGRIVDSHEYEARVSFVLLPDRPLVL